MTRPSGKLRAAPEVAEDDLRPFLSLSGLRDLTILGAVAVIGLAWGAGFLVPLALAVLAFVLITAASDWLRELLRRAGLALPRLVTDLLGGAIVLAGLFAVMFVLGSQATQFARALPRYEAHLDSAVGRLAGLIGNDLARMLQESFTSIDMSRLARSAFGGATSFLSTFLLICLYVIFLMAERATMARKILLAVGNRRRGAELAKLLAAISVSLQRYIGIKTLVSVLTAGFSYSVFLVLGLEFPETWAVLTFALNFIPSIGSIVAVVFPALMSLVQFESVTPFLVIVFGCGIVQFLIGNFLDPALMGRSLNLSTFTVVLTLTFWTAVWGLIGAFLSAPLTVCLLIVFSQIPALRPVAILMSKDGQPFADIKQVPQSPRNGG